MHNSLLLRLLIIALGCLLGASSLDVRLPPSIIQSPIVSKIFRSDDEVTLECVASGVPKPNYEWLKNGVSLIIPSASGNIYQISEGTIQINPLSSLDEGIYQCTAFNQYGKTLSQPSVLQRAILAPYGQNTPVFESPELMEGEPYTLYCQQTKCFPKPTYTWSIAESQIDLASVPIRVDKRVQLDEYGSLHFSYLLAADSQADKFYKCNVYNHNLDVARGGSYSRLRVKPVSTIQPLAPHYKFSSQTSIVALKGGNVSLRCFFSGYPDPHIFWTGERQLPIGRYLLFNQNTELVITDVRQTDEMAYNCKATNHLGNAEYTIHVDVQAAPVFHSENDRPHNVNVTEDDTVTLRCAPYAVPEAKIVWFNNGEELNPERLPPKFRIVSNGTHLMISNVCRDCSDGSSDIRVIQCNASNAHGSLFSDGYINILRKTVIEVATINVTVAATQVYASINCSAASDDSTPVKTRWYRFESKDGNFSLVYEIPGRVVVGSNGTLSFHVADNASSWATYEGRYKCVASNGYSTQSVEAFLYVEDIKLATKVTTALPDDIGTDSSSNYWFFVSLFLVAVVSIFLVLMAILCLYIRRKRISTGREDPVHESNFASLDRPMSGDYEIMPYAYTDAYDKIDDIIETDLDVPIQFTSREEPLPIPGYASLLQRPSTSTVYSPIDNNEQPIDREDIEISPTHAPESEQYLDIIESSVNVNAKHSANIQLIGDPQPMDSEDTEKSPVHIPEFEPYSSMDKSLAVEHGVKVSAKDPAYIQLISEGEDSSPTVSTVSVARKEINRSSITSSNSADEIPSSYLKINEDTRKDDSSEEIPPT